MDCSIIMKDVWEVSWCGQKYKGYETKHTSASDVLEFVSMKILETTYILVLGVFPCLNILFI